MNRTTLVVSIVAGLGIVFVLQKYPSMIPPIFGWPLAALSILAIFSIKQSRARATGDYLESRSLDTDQFPGHRLLLLGCALMVASLVWFAASLRVIQQSWSQVLVFALGPAMLLLLPGSACIAMAVYRKFLR